MWPLGSTVGVLYRAFGALGAVNALAVVCGRQLPRGGVCPCRRACRSHFTVHQCATLACLLRPWCGAPHRSMVSFQGKERFACEAAVPLVRVPRCLCAAAVPLALRCDAARECGGHHRRRMWLLRPQERSNYKNTVKSLKRLIGRKFSDPSVQAELENFIHFKVVPLADDEIGVQVRTRLPVLLSMCAPAAGVQPSPGALRSWLTLSQVMYDGETRTFPPQQVMGMLLNKLKGIANDANPAAPVADAVLSVPPYFTDAQRHALLDAAQIGVRCLPCVCVCVRAPPGEPTSRLVWLRVVLRASTACAFSTSRPPQPWRTAFSSPLAAPSPPRSAVWLCSWTWGRRTSRA